MRHSTPSRNRRGLLSILLACASLFAAPFAQAQSWTQATGEFQGGYVRGLFVPTLSTATATGDSWAAVYYGGMFKRTAGSSSWTPMNTGLTTKRVWNFTLTTSVSPYRGYAATLGGGVFKTTDGGANWTAVNNGLGCAYVRSIRFIGVAAVVGSTAVGSTAATNGIGTGATAASTDRLLAATTCNSKSGVYLSTDGGASWTATTGMPADVRVITVARFNPVTGIDFLLASTYDGLYKSIDNGLTWALSNGAMTSPNGVNINGVASLYNGSPAALTLYASEANTGVWKSTDNGATWGTAPVLSKLTSCCVVEDGNTNGNLYYPVDGEGMYKSTDRGATWALFVPKAALPGARALIRNTSATGSPEFYAQTFAGIYKSADGGSTWTKDSAGLPGGYAINVNFDTSGNAYVASFEGVYKAPPSPGGTFTRLGGYNLGIFGGHVLVSPADVPYAFTQHLGVFKFDGTNWVAKNAGLPVPMSRQGGSIRIDPKNANGLWLGLALGGIYYSANGGETWTAKNTGLTGKALEIIHMSVTSAFAIIATNAGVYKSTDTGATWTRLPFPAKSPANVELPNVELPLDRIRIDSGNGNIYAAVYETDPAGVTYPGSGIWKSTDGGATWTQSLVGKQVRDISIARNANDVTLYAGLWDAVGGGAMQSTDEGATWTPINTGLTTSNYINSFSVANGAMKTVATLGEGVFFFTPPVAAEALRIVSGWNLLGNGMSTALTVAIAFGDPTKVTSVWKWVPATSKWAFYAPSLVGTALTDFAASKGYDVLTTINSGEGFWVNAKAALAQPLAGTAVSSTLFQTLAPGWSLIAIGDRKTPSGFNRGLSTMPPSPGAVPINLTTLWAWNAAIANWYFYAPSLEANGGLSAYITSKLYLDFADKVLEPSAGFWVNKP